MTMPLWQGIATVAAVVLGTLVTRFLPFLLFPAGKPTPKFIQYLGRVLPFAVIGLLVILLPEGRVGNRFSLRAAGADRHYPGSGSPLLEEQYAVEHQLRHGGLHADGSVLIRGVKRFLLCFFRFLWL